LAPVGTAAISIYFHSLKQLRPEKKK